MNIAPIKKTLEKGLTPTGMIAASLITKDALGCYLYVTQARSNKKMTPKQRADVANYDLANGIINVALQLLAVKPIEKTMKKIIESKMMKHLFQNMDELFKDSRNSVVLKALKHKKGITEGAIALFSTAICQYVIKRGISPFFSVPAGEKTKQLGIIKPKLYAGETFTGKENEAATENEVAKENEITKPRFDVVSLEDDDTNLINRYTKYNTTV